MQIFFAAQSVLLGFVMLTSLLAYWMLFVQSMFEGVHGRIPRTAAASNEQTSGWALALHVYHIGAGAKDELELSFAR